MATEEEDAQKTSTSVPEAEEIYLDARHDFGAGMDGFGMTAKDGEFGTSLDLASVSNIMIEDGECRKEMEVSMVTKIGGV